MSNVLSREAESIRAVARERATEFEFREQLLACGVNVPYTKRHHHEGRLRHDTAVTAIGLDVKATTSFRAAIRAFRIGSDRDAPPINRSLFENLPRIRFALWRRLSSARIQGSSTVAFETVNFCGE